MSIASLSIGSPTWSSPGKSLAASETRPQPSRDRCCEASERPRDSERPARLNPLVAAMMEALGSLFRSSASSTQPAAPTAAATPSGAAPAPTSTIGTVDAPAANPSTPASPPAGDLREAALAFAYELYGALRGEGPGRGHGHGHGHRHEDHDKDGYRDHSGRYGGGYGNLAQRLTALAEKLDPAQPKPAGAATPPTPVSLPVPVSASTPAPKPAPAEAPPPPVLAGTPTATSTPATPPVADARGGIQITININFGGREPTDAPEADEPREPPLLSAFKKLLAALDPAATQDPSGLLSPQAKLAAFLRQIAQSLTAEAGDANPGLPAAGSLLSVSA